MGKIYAISDIHGYLDEFINALSKIDLSDKNNRLILIGDYIDNGTHSFQVISKIIELEELNYILKSNPKNFETGVRNEIISSSSPFINWFKKRYKDKRYYETDTQIFIHAGIYEG